MSIPKRHGAKWTSQEETKICKLFKAGKSIDKIAEKVERKANGVKAKLEKLKVLKP